MKIAVVGLGYVGLSIAVLLSQHDEVIAVDIVQSLVDKVNNKVSPVSDAEIQYFLATKDLNLQATLDARSAFLDASYIIIATPTNYDEDMGQFDTSSVDTTIAAILEVNPEATVVIKSTVPVGYTEGIRRIFGTNIIFSPEFLREGRALYDNLYPSRIILGDKSERAILLAKLLQEAAIKTDIPVLFMNSTEAEAVKLFANTYLALRIAFFNELDMFAEVNNLDSYSIIRGVSLDPRIGDYYNNPSFGYGGYCLPKDTKQLHASFKDIPHDVIDAVVHANETRIRYVSDMILSHNPHTVGVYLLEMKKGSDNFRNSAIKGVIAILQNAQIEVIAYEPKLQADVFEGLSVISNLDEFKSRSDVIIANRRDNRLDDVTNKLYCRDIFLRD